MTQAARSVASRLFASRQYVSEAMLVTPDAGSRDPSTGEWVPGAATLTTVRVVAVPLTDSERRDLQASGIRLIDLQKFYIREAVWAVVPGDRDGSIVRWNNTNWRAIRVNDWEGYHEVIGQRHEAIP